MQKVTENRTEIFHHWIITDYKVKKLTTNMCCGSSKTVDQMYFGYTDYFFFFCY